MIHLTKLLGFAAGVTLSLLAASTPVTAHPGQTHTHTRSLEEITQRRLFHDNTHRSLAACANTDASRQLNEEAAARRLATIQALRADRQRQRQLRAEAASDVLAKSHKPDEKYTNTTPSSTLFSSTNKCVLEPEVTQGPYYVSGELIRKDIRETQPGIDLYVELQFLDTAACTVVPKYYVDFWHCNATGVYSGVVASGNGNSNDASNINATHSRGLYPTDDSGVVQFLTKFPGHYTGRTTHIHILGSHNGSVLANNTYSGGGVSSVGQLFFDQTLLTEVAKTTAYAVNTQTVTLNSADNILTESAATGFDPVVQYVYLGDTVEEGIFAWISVGVDTSVSKTVGAAATMTASGGVANANNNAGGGPGGNGAPGGNGGPSGNGTPGNTTNTTTTPTPSTTAPSTSGAITQFSLAAATTVVAAVATLAAMV